MKRILPALLLALAVAGAPAHAQPDRSAKHDGSGILQQLQKADANADGQTSRAEVTAFRAKQFKRLDRDKDGLVSASDVPAMAKGRMPEGMSVDQMFKTFDKSGDGKVSREEFVSGPMPAFELVDSNKDGVVSTAELDAARARSAGGQGQRRP